MSFEATLTTACRDTGLFVILLSPSEFSGSGCADSMIVQRKHRHSDTPDVYVFEAESHEDIRVMIDYWKEVEFEIHPALDLAASFRQQGMKIA